MKKTVSLFFLSLSFLATSLWAITPGEYLCRVELMGEVHEEVVVLDSDSIYYPEGTGSDKAGYLVDGDMMIINDGAENMALRMADTGEGFQLYFTPELLKEALKLDDESYETAKDSFYFKAILERPFMTFILQ